MGQTSPNATVLVVIKCHILMAEEEGELPVGFHHLVKKPASLKVRGCINAYGMDILDALERTMNAEKYLKMCVFQQSYILLYIVLLAVQNFHVQRTFGASIEKCMETYMRQK